MPSKTPNVRNVHIFGRADATHELKLCDRHENKLQRKITPDLSAFIASRLVQTKILPALRGNSSEKIHMNVYFHAKGVTARRIDKDGKVLGPSVTVTFDQTDDLDASSIDEMVAINQSVLEKAGKVYRHHQAEGSTPNHNHIPLRGRASQYGPISHEVNPQGTSQTTPPGAGNQSPFIGQPVRQGSTGHGSIPPSPQGAPHFTPPPAPQVTPPGASSQLPFIGHPAQQGLTGNGSIPPSPQSAPHASRTTPPGVGHQLPFIGQPVRQGPTGNRTFLPPLGTTPQNVPRFTPPTPQTTPPGVGHESPFIGHPVRQGTTGNGSIPPLPLTSPQSAPHFTPPASQTTPPGAGAGNNAPLAALLAQSQGKIQHLTSQLAAQQQAAAQDFHNAQQASEEEKEALTAELEHQGRVAKALEQEKDNFIAKFQREQGVLSEQYRRKAEQLQASAAREAQDIAGAANKAIAELTEQHNLRTQVLEQEKEALAAALERQQREAEQFQAATKQQAQGVVGATERKLTELTEEFNRTAERFEQEKAGLAAKHKQKKGALNERHRLETEQLQATAAREAQDIAGTADKEKAELTDRYNLRTQELERENEGLAAALERQQQEAEQQAQGVVGASEKKIAELTDQYNLRTQELEREKEALAAELERHRLETEEFKATAAKEAQEIAEIANQTFAQFQKFEGVLGEQTQALEVLNKEKAELTDQYNLRTQELERENEVLAAALERQQQEAEQQAQGVVGAAERKLTELTEEFNRRAEVFEQQKAGLVAKHKQKKGTLNEQHRLETEQLRATNQEKNRELAAVQKQNDEAIDKLKKQHHTDVEKLLNEMSDLAVDVKKAKDALKREQRRIALEQQLDVEKEDNYNPEIKETDQGEPISTAETDDVLPTPQLATQLASGMESLGIQISLPALLATTFRVNADLLNLQKRSYNAKTHTLLVTLPPDVAARNGAAEGTHKFTRESTKPETSSSLLDELRMLRDKLGNSANNVLKTRTLDAHFAPLKKFFAEFGRKFGEFNTHIQSIEREITELNKQLLKIDPNYKTGRETIKKIMQNIKPPPQFAHIDFSVIRNLYKKAQEFSKNQFASLFKGLPCKQVLHFLLLAEKKEALTEKEALLFRQVQAFKNAFQPLASRVSFEAKK